MRWVFKKGLSMPEVIGLFVFLGCVILLCSPSQAEMIPLFGPKPFIRGTGAPQQFTETFQNCWTAAQYKIVVVNGNSEGTNRISSASISLNYVQIIGPRDFNQQVAKIERAISVLEANQLGVLLEGKPGSLLTVSVECMANCQIETNLSPVVTLNNSATTTIAGQPGVTNISLTGTNFPSGTICPSNVTVSLEPVTAGGGATGSITASAVSTISDSTRQVSFQIPSSIAVLSPTAYWVSIAGTTTTGTAFSSINKVSLILNPPFILSINHVAPSPIVANQPITVYFSLHNISQAETSGKVIGEVDGESLISTVPTDIVLQPGQIAAGTLSAASIPPGTHTLTLKYQPYDPSNPLKYEVKAMEKYEIDAIDPRAVCAVACNYIYDGDGDGIRDTVEAYLLERFRPYYKFSKEYVGDDLTDEHYNPTDVWWYIQQSELLYSGDEDSRTIISNDVLTADPFAILSATEPIDRFCSQDLDGIWHCSSDITLNKAKTLYHLNPMAEVHGISGDPGRHGSDWSEVLSKGNVGLYGHVVPYLQGSGQAPLSKCFVYNISAAKFEYKYCDRYGFPITDPDFPYDQGIKPDHTYYKIEYWQFFGYNNANQANNLADHEGDWTTVQLLYDPDKDKEGEFPIVSVFHYLHGDQIRFDMSSMSDCSSCSVNLLSETNYLGEISTVKEFRGPNSGKSVSFPLPALDIQHIIEAVNLSNAQNHIVRFYMDPDSEEYSHPVVYIEYGAHEFWPSEYWSFDFAPKHGGDFYSYLTSTPPNLGEVEHPLSETEASEIILKYNGKWGAFSYSNDPPEGPPLHDQWTWPADSSIRWLLGNLEHPLGY